MSAIDRDEVNRYVKMVSASLAQGFSCAISAVGDHLGLYRAMNGAGALGSEDLARLTGLNERWLREWLRHQAAVGHLQYNGDDDRFTLSDEAALVLANAESPAFLAGGFDAVLAAMPAVPKVEEAFATGLGMTYDDHGEACACGLERMSGYAQKYELVNRILPLVDGLVERLESGIQVADVGCGSAQSTIAMAQAFPQTKFFGYDTSNHALTRATENVRASGVDNVVLLNPEQVTLADNAPYDLITTFDVVHDTPFPGQLIREIREALKNDGVWLCEDIRSLPTFAENLEKHPLASLLYGFSVMVCMSSGLSAEGGAGLGTLGFSEPVAREMTAAAGFNRFERLDYDNPINAFYAIQP